MTKFHIIDTMELIKSQTGYFIDLSSVNQDLIPEHSEEDLECLDDFIDKIEHQTIKVKDNGVAAYIRTSPIEKLNIPEPEKKEEPKKGFLQRLFGSSKADEEPKTSGTTNEVFGVDFKGLETQVFGRKTEQGTAYDIFINTNKHAIDQIRKDINDNLDITVDVYLEPVKTGSYQEDIRRVYRRISNFFGSLAELYDKVGIREGNLLLNTDFDGARERVKDLHKKVAEDSLKEGKTFGNTTFYEAVTSWREEAVVEKGPIKIIPVDKKGEKRKTETSPIGVDFSDPSTVREVLNQYIVGQEKAKQVVADAVCDHYHISKSEKLKDASANILLAGASGCGKTYLAEVVAKHILRVPFYETSLAGMSQAAYKGGDVSSILEGLIEKAGSIEKAQTGVVFLDELDKIAKGDDVHQVATGKVQDELLRMLNGNVVQTKYGEIDTSRILFICAGAFDELRQVKEPEKRMGFTAQKEEEKPTVIYKLDEESLMQYGLKREIVGRIPYVCPVQDLTEKQLESILTKPKESLLGTYQELLKQYGIELDFSSDAVNYMAHVAHSKGTGARALKTVVAKTLEGMREKPNGYVQDSKLTITKDIVEKKLSDYER